MKRGLKFGFVFITLAILILSVNSVYAASAKDAFKPIVDMFAGAIEAVYDALAPMISAVLGETSGSASFVGKLLMFIIILALCYVVLSRSMSNFFDDHKWALWLISKAVPILGFRFIDADIVAAAALPSSAFAIAVTAGIPFVLWFFLIEGFPKTLKRIGWILFAVVFYML